MVHVFIKTLKVHKPILGWGTGGVMGCGVGLECRGRGGLGDGGLGDGGLVGVG